MHQIKNIYQKPIVRVFCNYSEITVRICPTTVRQKNDTNPRWIETKIDMLIAKG